MKKIAILSMLLATMGALSCASGASQEEYDRVNSELLALQSQMATMQGKLAEAQLVQTQNEALGKQYEAMKGEFDALQADYEELSNKYEDMSEQYNTTMSQFEALQADYEALSDEYEEMSEQYEILTKGAAKAEAAAEFSKEDVEQAIFKQINQERIDNGVAELEWGVNIYKWAKENSFNMATNKRYEYSSYASWQEILWAAGHNSAESIANAAMIVWRDSLQYERNMINTVATYGAVGVYESAGIYYITFITSPFR
jgi:uncharacterized protein YkwD